MKVLEPLKAVTLKEEFITRFEELILSGVFPVGRWLPPERELAKTLKVSRPVVHEGLLDLASKGLITLYPRRGTKVNDYRKDGSLELLVSLSRYTGGSLEPGLLAGILEMRLLFEKETARLAALNRTEEDTVLLEELLEEEKRFESMSASEIALLDYRFHHQVALSGGNLIYPLLMNSLKPLYLGILEKFYLRREVLPGITVFHQEIVMAVILKSAGKAAEAMEKMLIYSQEELGKLYGSGDRTSSG